MARWTATTSAPVSSACRASSRPGAPRGEADDAELLRPGGDDLQRLGADGAGTAQDHHVAHGASVPYRGRPARCPRRRTRAPALSAAAARVAPCPPTTPRPSPAAPRARRRCPAPAIAAFLDAVEAAPDLELHSLMVLRHGQVVAEGWWAPYGPDEAHLLYSLSKSFTSTAARPGRGRGPAVLRRAGRSLLPRVRRRHDPRVEPRDAGPARSPRWPPATSRTPWTGSASWTPPSRYAASCGAAGAGARLGVRYNNAATYVLGAIVQRLTGQTLTELPAAAAVRPAGHRPRPTGTAPGPAASWGSAGCT